MVYCKRFKTGRISHYCKVEETAMGKYGIATAGITPDNFELNINFPTFATFEDAVQWIERKAEWEPVN